MVKQRVSLQQVYDRAAKHMLREGFSGELSRDKSHFYAMYQDENGNRCPVGLFMSKGYGADLEGIPVRDPAVQEALDIEVNKPVLKLLIELQKLHDEVLPELWKGRLRSIAKRFKLHTTAIDGRKGRR